MKGMSTRFALPALLALAALAGPLATGADAQYFGRNKVQYRTFDFSILKTDHFDVYYYDEERAAAEQAGRMAERWYERLSTLLDHQLSGRQVLILYASHPHFEQTNAIAGDIGEGTGGVTEYLKRRIVLPLAGPLAENDHVIGHELVHAFQFDIGRGARPGSGFSDPAVLRLPLWFVEGMAEYLSIGNEDPNTAMWIRDAAATNKVPSIHKLNDPNYFPYRYGQAFWAYVAGRWGDRRVGEVFKAAAVTGDAERALERVLGVAADSLSDDWRKAVTDWYGPVADRTLAPESAGRKLIEARKGRGRLNVAPALSPDGKRLVFLSERDLFSIEMFLADAETGQVLRRITRTAVDPHFQSLQFIQSSGSFSADGKRFAFAAVSRGVPVLTVVDPSNGRHLREVPLKAFDEIFNPTWSPDGDRIAFTALTGGVTDLFIVDVATGAVRRLTDDLYSDLAPAWSPDGRRIAFVTDRFSTDLDDLDYGNERLALIDPDTGRIEPVSAFDDAKHINPQWAPDGRALYFISDEGGISNLYRVTLTSGAIERLTNLRTGVSGITRLSPALSVARHADRAVASVYQAGGYVLYAIDDLSRARPSATPAKEPATPAVAAATDTAGAAAGIEAPPSDGPAAAAPVTPAVTPVVPGAPEATGTPAATATGAPVAPSDTPAPDPGVRAHVPGPSGGGGQAAAGPARPGVAVAAPVIADALPPTVRDSAVVNQFAREPRRGLTSASGFTRADYRPGLSLDYVSQPTLGVAAGSNGVAFGGGTTLYWSDMLGNHNLATLLQVNNEGGNFFNNLAAVAAYENLSSRWNWGVIAGQIPYLTSGFDYTDDTLPSGEPVRRWREVRYWQIDRQLTGTVSYPFNSVQRLEFSGGYLNVDFVSEQETTTYSLVTGNEVEGPSSSAIDDSLDAINLVTTSAALVYDTSVFGGTGPVLGQRWRIEASPTGGDLNYVGLLTDYRRYVPLVRPFSLAVRALHFGRYGGDGEDPRLTELFLGYPWLIRGYNSESFKPEECLDAEGTICPELDRLFGSRIALANVELRMPLFGSLGVVYSPAVPPVELAAFFDTGVAWTQAEKASFLGGPRDPVSSYGAASRVNLFGIAIAEFSLVHPNDREQQGWYWEFSLQPGF